MLHLPLLLPRNHGRPPPCWDVSAEPQDPLQVGEQGEEAEYERTLADKKAGLGRAAPVQCQHWGVPRCWAGATLAQDPRRCSPANGVHGCRSGGCKLSGTAASC